MKKLMIALAAVAVAAGVQAASIDWASTQNSNFKGYDGKALATSMPVYLIDSTYIDTIVAAINNGTIGNVDKETGKFVTQGVLEAGTWANTRGGIAKHTVNGGSALVYDKGVTTYDFAQLIIDNVNGSPDTYYNISQAITKAAYDPSKTDEFAATTVTFGYDMFSADNSQTGGWVKAQAVPEPTSGLLLLLGVAGLALRRRRRA